MLLQRVCRGMLTTLLLHGVLPVLQAEHHTCRYHSAAFQCKLMLFVSCIFGRQHCAEIYCCSCYLYQWCSPQMCKIGIKQ